MEVHSYTGLPQEKRKIPNNNTKELGKEEQTKPKVNRRKQLTSEQKYTQQKFFKIGKVNKAKIWFFRKINKINKPLAKLIKKKKESAQINKIRKEKLNQHQRNAKNH